MNTMNTQDPRKEKRHPQNNNNNHNHNHNHHEPYGDNCGYVVRGGVLLVGFVGVV